MLLNFICQRVFRWFTVGYRKKNIRIKKAVYYPELNQIDFLSLKKIKTIDTLLGTKWRKGDFIYNPFYSATDLNREEQEKFNDYAVAKRIFIKNIDFDVNVENVLVDFFQRHI